MVQEAMNALVLGGANCVWDDLAQVPDGWADVVIAINDVGSHYPGVLHHWVSLHPENFPAWEATRDVLGHPNKRHGHPYIKWGRNRPAGVDVGPIDKITTHWGGSSGGLAVNVALKELKADMVVLCGVPQDKRPHYHSGPKEWEHWDVYWKDWVRYHHDGHLDKVRSLSGRTRDLLGAPDWVSENE